MTLDIGTKLGHYEIRSLIGSGGMGEVYSAEDGRLDRLVALKVLLANVADDEERVRRFVQEAKAASALNHPNILTVFEIGDVENSRYIATELIKGKTLRNRLDTDPLTLTETLDTGIQIAAALNAAHEAGIIHRDIKPENIMLRDDGVVKVLDFGLAKLTEKESEASSSESLTKALVNTRPGMVMGTATYMSPEQARGKPVDARTDIWSLGVVLFELLTGKIPFEGDGPMDTISSILKDPTPSVRTISPDLPRQMDRIVDKTLRKDADQRYQHIKDLLIDLEDLRNELVFEAKLSQTGDALRPAPANTTLLTKPDTTADAKVATGHITTAQVFKERRFTLFHAFAFATAIVVIVAGVWLYRSRNASHTAPGSYKVSDVASWNSAPGELFSSARFSPDGKLIAFSSTKTGTKNIWVKQTTSTDAIKVTDDSFSNKDPIWSTKGDEIAFISDRGNAVGGPPATGIWRVSALGAGVPKSVGAVADGSSELRRWTQNGGICYQSRGELYAMDPSSGASRKLTDLGQKFGPISWVDISPDEQRIAFVANKDNMWRIYESSLDGGSPTTRLETKDEINGTAWLPEKGRLFFGASVDGVYQVFVVDGSAEPRRLTSSENDSVVVDAASDGKSILLSSAKEDSNIWKVTIAKAEESVVAREIDSELWPSVAPDDTRIVFQSVKNLSRGRHIFDGSLFARSLKASGETESPQVLVGNAALPSWSPNGSEVAFLRANGASFDLRITNQNGGSERALSTGGIASVGYSVSPYNTVQTSSFAWTPDGTGVAYVSDRNGAANVWLVSPRDGSDAPMTDNSEPNIAIYCPIWSPDGKQIAYFAQTKSPGSDGKTTRAVRILDLESRKSAVVLETDKGFRLIGWDAAGTGLLIAEPDKFSSLPPETALRRIPANGGAVSDIVKIKNCYYYNIFLSDDRKNIAFAARENERDDIWVVPSTGGQPRKLTTNNDSSLYFSRLAWLHDGSAVVFGKQSRFSMLSMLNNID